MSAQRRFLPMMILAFSMVALVLSPSSAVAQNGANPSDSVTPSTVRTTKGDLVTGDAEAFAEALEQIGPDGEVMVWIKETTTPRPSAEFLLKIPGSAAETIALKTEAPGAKRRNNFGPAAVRGASIEAVIRALSGAGAPAPRRMETLPVFVVKLPVQVRHAALEVLLRHPNVDYISAVRSHPVELLASPVGSNPIDTKHTVHKIPQVWDLTRGNGATIGIIDSGLARNATTGNFHDDAQYIGSYGILTRGFIDDLCGSANAGACSPYDDATDGHGTLMAGLAGANDNGLGYVGIAPFATTYSLKTVWNTRVSGQGHCGDNPFNESTYCIETDDFVRTVDYAATRRFSVLSMSFAGDMSGDSYRALQTAYNSYGVFLVGATGNTLNGSAKEPASFDVVLGIAGVDAAGNNIYSTAARDVSGFAGGGTTSAYCYRDALCNTGAPSIYAQTGGTSAATANVAGIVALLRSRYPSETAPQIWARLVNTAEGVNRVVNAYAAITYKHPLSVTISGNSTPQQYTIETWTAVPASGTGPYSYSWSKDGAFVGSDATYTDDVYDYAFQLQVTVTDALGATATNWLFVSPTVPAQ
ncbi:MAG TPA: S8 family serine peptidase [Thermoanaerobaculia bacterium]|nr:S8 family serine peptidase [Thermoanaerobaculia bacterium]